MRNRDKNKPHLVWVRGSRAPSPQIWHAPWDMGLQNWKEQHVLAMHPLTPTQMQLTLDELAESFPLPT